jgi:hypothetical protein
MDSPFRASALVTASPTMWPFRQRRRGGPAASVTRRAPINGIAGVAIGRAIPDSCQPASRQVILRSGRLTFGMSSELHELWCAILGLNQ